MKKIIQTSALSLMVGAFLAPNLVEAEELEKKPLSNLEVVKELGKDLVKKGKEVFEETPKVVPRILDAGEQASKTLKQVTKHMKKDAPEIGKTIKKTTEAGVAIVKGTGRLLSLNSEGADPYGADSKEAESKKAGSSGTNSTGVATTEANPNPTK